MATAAFIGWISLELFSSISPHSVHDLPFLYSSGSKPEVGALSDNISQQPKT